MSDNLTKRGQPDRSKINIHEPHEVKYWSHALGVSKQDIQKAVDKVGNSAAAVRKELGLLGAQHDPSRIALPVTGLDGCVKTIQTGLGQFSAANAAQESRVNAKQRRSWCSKST